MKEYFLEEIVLEEKIVENPGKALRRLEKDCVVICGKLSTVSTAVFGENRGRDFSTGTNIFPTGEIVENPGF